MEFRDNDRLNEITVRLDAVNQRMEELYNRTKDLTDESRDKPVSDEERVRYGDDTLALTRYKVEKEDLEKQRDKLLVRDLKVSDSMEENFPVGRMIKYGVESLDQDERDALLIGSTEKLFLSDDNKIPGDMILGESYFDYKGWNQHVGPPQGGLEGLYLPKVPQRGKFVESMITRSDNASGQDTVPTMTMAEVSHALKHYGSVKMMSRNVSTPTGETREWPTANTTGQLGTTYDTEDTGPAKADMPNFGKRTSITKRTDSGEMQVTTDFLRDSAISVETEMANQTLERIGRRENRNFVLGLGNGHATQGAGSVGGNRFYGIQASANAEVSTATTGQIAYADLQANVAAVDWAYLMPTNGVFDVGAYNVGYMLNSTAMIAILYMTDADNRPIFAYDDLGVGRIDKRFRVEVNNEFAILATAGNVYGVFGNFYGYMVRDVGGIQVRVYNAATDLAAARDNAGAVVIASHWAGAFPHGGAVAANKSDMWVRLKSKT